MVLNVDNYVEKVEEQTRERKVSHKEGGRA